MKFGYRPDPTEALDLTTGQKVDLLAKDFDFRTGLLPALVGATNGDVDLSKYTTDTHQGRASACAGNATADSVEVLTAVEEEDRAKAEGRLPKPVPQLSRMFVYALARGLQDDDGDGQGDLNRDEGTYIRLCYEVLSRFGICEESAWQYDTSKVFVAPSIKAMRQAVGHRIHSYYRIKESGQDRLDEIVSALRARHPVVFGTQITKSFQDNNGPEVVDKPTTATAGGHAMMIVGYQNGLFKVKNSWGSGWRRRGFCFMTPEYIAWDATRDLWVPTKGYRTT